MLWPGGVLTTTKIMANDEQNAPCILRPSNSTNAHSHDNNHVYFRTGHYKVELIGTSTVEYLRRSSRTVTNGQAL